MGLNVEIRCNPLVPASNFITLDSSDKCNPKVVLESTHGCPLANATSFIRVLNSHSYIIGALLLIFGFITAFNGRIFFNKVVGVIGGLTAYFMIMLFCSHLGMLDALDPLYSQGSIFLAILAFVFAAVISVIVGTFLSKHGTKFGILTIGIVDGFLAGVIIYNLIFYHTDSLQLYVLLGLIGALIFGYLAMKYS